MAAFRAIDSKAEPSAYACKRQDSSRTKSVPAFPEGMLKIFLRQCTTTEYVKAEASNSPQQNCEEAIDFNSGRVGIPETCLLGEAERALLVNV